LLLVKKSDHLPGFETQKWPARAQCLCGFAVFLPTFPLFFSIRTKIYKCKEYFTIKKIKEICEKKRVFDQNYRKVKKI
jgi:hypothetical protein